MRLCSVDLDVLHLAAAAADQVVAFGAVDVLDIPLQAVELGRRVHRKCLDSHLHVLVELEPLPASRARYLPRRVLHCFHGLLGWRWKTRFRCWGRRLPDRFAELGKQPMLCCRVPVSSRVVSGRGRMTTPDGLGRSSTR